MRFNEKQWNFKGNLLSNRNILSYSVELVKIKYFKNQIFSQ